MNTATSTVQIARVVEPIPELHYDGEEGYVVEVDGQWVADAPNLSLARAWASANYSVGEFVEDDAADYWGRQTWTGR